MIKASLLIIVPAFNEATAIKKTLKGIKETLPEGNDILVVDDGSNDNTGEIAKKTGVFVIRHPINRGLGGALGTGLFWAKVNDYQFAVTFDADGQHDPADLYKVWNLLKKNAADVVVGTRTRKGWQEIPKDRKIVITLSNLFTWFLTGMKTTDSLSGLRGFNRKAIEKIQIRTDQMEVSNEFFFEIQRHHLRYREIPIKVIYTDYSRSKGQKNSNSLDVAAKLLVRLFR